MKGGDKAIISLFKMVKETKKDGKECFDVDMKEIKNVMMNVVMLVTCVLFVPVLVLLVWMLLFLTITTIVNENQLGNILIQYVVALIGMGITLGLFQLILKPINHLITTIKEMRTRKKWIEELQQEIKKP